ncbi:unnamed protein product [Rotaria sp. Silwood2]|nr:unnamed protein product [Rotaria sp. Silwood2]CAF2735948.1 unnamed protein product [Rotaria sp. Silwood2]CAF3095513.1 unnamed protein product [Rotaria sp. Silwood2]CAF4079303.1 unnamed protein product [Rotaria sp. Silwood2]CAF4142521.1 unnamed protein product [Rotaria sp. Silwood2]
MSSITTSSIISGEPLTTVLVSAIPKSFRSADLRNFFSVFVETQAFRCFHFRHRPMPTSSTNAVSASQMCFIQVYNKRLNEFIRLYHRKHWIDLKGNYLSSICLISKVTNEDNDSTITNNLIELKPPKHIYPQGNVGTPTSYFLNEINACRLPSTIIKKLGLVFPKCRSKRKYGCVGFDYGTIIDQDDDDEEEEETEDIDEMNLKTGQGHEILSEQDKTTLDKLNKQKEDDEREKDDIFISNEDKQLDEEEDELEEWDRHEAQYDDVTKQDRTSPYFFDHKIELKWEKGGSGLVFYTDDVFWKEHEGQDFDNLDMADDIDIDMRMYHESAGSADRDGNELQSIRREEDLRQGRISNETDSEHKRIGAFEKHTKGIGRRLLERDGWRDGQGLGSSVTGISEALTADGGKLSIKDKTGLGYTGEKIERNPYKRIATGNHQRQGGIHITTIYDDPEETDPAEPHNRRWATTRNKNRPRRIKNVFAKP